MRGPLTEAAMIFSTQTSSTSFKNWVTLGCPLSVKSTPIESMQFLAKHVCNTRSFTNPPTHPPNLTQSNPPHHTLTCLFELDVCTFGEKVYYVPASEAKSKCWDGAFTCVDQNAQDIVRIVCVGARQGILLHQVKGPACFVWHLQ